MILGILSRNRKLHSIQRLLKEAKTLRVRCEVIDPLDCQILVSKGGGAILVNERGIEAPDIILPRIGTSVTEYGLSVVRQFENLKVKTVNSSLGIAQSRDKLRCLQILGQKGFDVPTTVLLRSVRGLKMALRQIYGTPAVLKVLQGTQGVGVMIVESPSSLQSVMETMWSQGEDVLIQQYVVESAGRDIRAFVIGDKVVAAMRRQAKPGEFRSNIHQGGEGVVIDLAENYKKAAIGATKTLGLSIAGVDILESLTGPKIIEVNSSPGFEGIEKATGLNVARMIIKHCKEHFRKIKKR